MSETIQTKRCSKCKNLKPFSEFYKDGTKKNGRRSQCIICGKIYLQTNKCKKAARDRAAKRARSIEGQENMKIYRQSGKGKKAQRRRTSRYENKNPHKIKARTEVKKAIINNKLPHPTTLQCSCGEQAQQYHHHKGYSPEYWLDVVPICIKCHRKTI